MNINIERKSFSFKLTSVVNTSKNKILYKHGWIIKLKNDNNNFGYGEISPISQIDLKICEDQINKIININKENDLIENIRKFHPCIQSALNSAIAEMNGELKFKDIQSFTEIYESAILVNSNTILKELNLIKENKLLRNKKLTLKWKVAINDNQIEEKILEKILSEISDNIKIRIDANGSWNRKIAHRWANIIADSAHLDWLEQPLSTHDIEGLNKLNEKIPVAIDESLMKYPELIKLWEGWQIRRPSQESNPILLFEELRNKVAFRSISTSFETGIGSRLLHHFASLQLKGPTPKVPGLALSQIPKTILFSDNVNQIWEIL